MVNSQFNSVSRPRPTPKRGEKGDGKQRQDKTGMGWDGMGEIEKVGTDKESKSVRDVCVRLTA